MLYFRCHQLGEVGWTSVQRPTPGPATSEARAFTDKRRGLQAETAPLALTVIFKLIIGGLTSIILIVLDTVNLQFQGPFVPISLRLVLRIVAAYVVGTIWSSYS